MRFLIVISSILILLNLTIPILSWGYDRVISEEDLAKNKNYTKEFFEKGFKEHTVKVGFRLKTSQNDEVNIFVLKSKYNKLQVKYNKNENTVVFLMTVDLGNRTSYWEIKFPQLNLESDGFHYLVYRLGKQYFKLWIDCDLRRSSNGDFKTSIQNIDQVYTNFGNHTELEHGESNDIEYNEGIKFNNHPELDYSFSDRSTCKYTFNKTDAQIRINSNNETEGVFHPLELFQEVLTKHETPGVYYEIKENTRRDVSEYFEDGLDKDHSFEMTYRITDFPPSNYSYYFILLKSGAESQISLSFSGKRNIVTVHGSINRNGDLINYNTDYWVDEIYNNDWHTIKYELRRGIFTLWVDGEVMEDYLGYKHVNLKFNGYDTGYTWYDTMLMIFEPKSGLHREPVMHIRHMKYYGNAVTTSNTELPLTSDDKKEESSYMESFMKTVGRLSLK